MSTTPVCCRRGCGKPVSEHAIKGRGRRVELVCPGLPPQVQLVGFGRANARPAQLFAVGDVVLFNYGYACVVRSVDVHPFTSAVDFVLENLNGVEVGEQYTWRKKKDTLVPYSDRGEDFWRGTK